MLINSIHYNKKIYVNNNQLTVKCIQVLDPLIYLINHPTTMKMLKNKSALITSIIILVNNNAALFLLIKLLK